MGEKSARNLMDSIEKSKSSDLNRLIYALGIRHVGEQTAWILAEHYGSLEKMESAGPEELEEVKEIGPVMAESVYNFFRSAENLSILKKLKTAGLKISSRPAAKAEGPLAGKIVVITGALKSISRPEAEEAVRRSGGKASSSVSKNTDLLVYGEEPGSKLAKAKALGVRIVTEEEFRRLIG